MKTYSYIALAALALSFTACQQEEDFIPQGDVDAVKIVANIGKLQTRVSYGDGGTTTFDEGDRITVANKLRTSKNEATYICDANGKWITTDPFVWNSTSKNQFKAWYPATASYTTFTIPTDQSTERLLAAADWMTAVTNEIDKPANHTVDLCFKHRLAKVTVSIKKWNSEFENSEKKIENPIIYTKGTDIEVSYGTGENGADVYTSDGTLTAVTPLVSDNEFTAILAPVKYDANDRFMTFTVGDRELTVLANETLTDGIGTGSHYSFELIVGKDAVVINSVSVFPWGEKTIEGGVAVTEF